MEEIRNQVSQLLFPHYTEEVSKVRSDDLLFGHYTSADVAVQILRNKMLWMRKASMMNDFSEVDHGLRLIKSAIETLRPGLIVDEIFPELWSEVLSYFDPWSEHFKENTYIACVSRRPADDSRGRLSMWRAYGRKCGVEVVLNNSVFLDENESYGVFSTPVLYAEGVDVNKWLGRIIENIKNHSDVFKEFGRDNFRDYLFHMLRCAAVSIKHPGFREENEWRIIYCPSFESGNNVVRDVEVIGGVPQMVHKLVLSDVRGGAADLVMNSMLNRIIVGPCDHSYVVQDALIFEMQKAGIMNAAEKVLISEIPLR